jgi:circadian clock protein KaiC
MSATPRLSDLGPHEIARVSTGNREADSILGGGFPANSINIIMGAPGTGKTLFAQQLALSYADASRPVLYLTTLSEPMAKVVTYLQGLSFYDEAKVGNAVRYEDLGAELLEHGVMALVERVRTAIKEFFPKLIVIDSFKALHDLTISAAETRRFVAELAGLVTAFDTTTFLVGEYTEEEITRYPEFAIADGIIEFARHKRATSDERYVRVSKLRGSGYREGLHGFKITGAGLDFFPRLISPEFPKAYKPSAERIRTGVAGLDAMLDGGLQRGTCALVIGPTGSGKTTLALQYAMEGIKSGEPVLYINFQENPSQLSRVVESLGGPAAGGAELWNAMYVSPVELQIDSLIGRAFQTLREKKIRRLVLDSVGDLLLAAGDNQRVHDYLYAFTQHMARSEVSSLLTFETGLGLRSRGGSLTEHLHFSALTDAIILFDLEAGDRLQRSACILKARNTSHDLAIRAMEITAQGIRIA